MTELEKDILEIIKAHVGYNDAINQYKMTQQYNATYNKDVNCREVRDVITRLIKQKYPIISTPRGKGGYCWAGKDESLECYKRLRHQGLLILLRARHTLRNSRMGQLDLDIRF
jgi:hypothetical protein